MVVFFHSFLFFMDRPGFRTKGDFTGLFRSGFLFRWVGFGPYDFIFPSTYGVFTDTTTFLSVVMEVDGPEGGMPMDYDD